MPRFNGGFEKIITRWQEGERVGLRKKLRSMTNWEAGWSKKIHNFLMAPNCENASCQFPPKICSGRLGFQHPSPPIGPKSQFFFKFCWQLHKVHLLCLAATFTHVCNIWLTEHISINLMSVILNIWSSMLIYILVIQWEIADTVLSS